MSSRLPIYVSTYIGNMVLAPLLVCALRSDPQSDGTSALLLCSLLLQITKHLSLP
jgi:hypothetical protein